RPSWAAVAGRSSALLRGDLPEVAPCFDRVAQRQPLARPGDLASCPRDQPFEGVQLEVDDDLVLLDRLAHQPYFEELRSALADCVLSREPLFEAPLKLADMRPQLFAHGLERSEIEEF